MIGKAGMMSRRPVFTVPGPPTNAVVGFSNSTTVYAALYAGEFDPNNPIYGGDSDVLVTWNVPAYDGGSAITGYRVRFSDVSPHPSQIVSGSTFSKTFFDFGWIARACRDRTIYITAINAEGESSPAIVSFYTPPLPVNSPTVLRAFTTPVYGSYQSTYELAWAPICGDPSNNGQLRKVVPGVNGVNAFGDPTGDFTSLPYTHWQIQYQQTVYNNWLIFNDPSASLGTPESSYATTTRSRTNRSAIPYDVHQRKWRIRTVRVADGELYYGAWSNVEITEP